MAQRHVGSNDLKVTGYVAELDGAFIEFDEEFGHQPYFDLNIGDTVYVRKAGDGYHVTANTDEEWYADGTVRSADTVAV